MKVSLQRKRELERQRDNLYNLSARMKSVGDYTAKKDFSAEMLDDLTYGDLITLRLINDEYEDNLEEEIKDILRMRIDAMVCSI